MTANSYQIVLITLGLGFTAYVSSGQSSVREEYANTIVAADLRRHLSILASDSLGGRGTGQPGQELAAQYLAAEFKSYGVRPPVITDSGSSFFQEVLLEKIFPSSATIQHEDGYYSTASDIVSNGDLVIPEATVYRTLFIGRGREKDLEDLRVKGKAVVLFGPTSDERKEIIARTKKAGAGAFICFNYTKESLFERFKTRTDRDLEEGDIQAVPSEADPTINFIVGPELAAELVGLEISDLIQTASSEEPLSRLDIKPKSQSIRITNIPHRELIQAKNVLGYLPGTDKADELLIITAHYDHLGTKGNQIFNGADDDGTGTSAILEIAEAFALAAQAGHKPRRSLLFMAVTAEEHGLLGSKFYVDHPLFPLNKTVVNLNIDMIGRTDDRHLDEEYVYVIGSNKLSTDLHNVSEEVNALYASLMLDYRYNNETDPNRFYYRSDHYNFVKKNIPVIFYFSGIHEDYHRPTDTIEKIQFTKVEKTARLIFQTAWEIANREKTIELD